MVIVLIELVTWACRYSLRGSRWGIEKISQFSYSWLKIFLLCIVIIFMIFITIVVINNFIFIIKTGSMNCVIFSMININISQNIFVYFLSTDFLKFILNSIEMAQALIYHPQWGRRWHDFSFICVLIYVILFFWKKYKH